jgi:hypothetical protein
MTAFEKITDQIATLREAENRCVKRGKLFASFIWHRHAAKLAAKREAMTVEQAELAV